MTREGSPPFYLGPPSQFELDMQRLEDIASAPSAPIEAIAAAPMNAINDQVPLIDAPLIDAAIENMIAEHVAIEDAASHAVIDGPASAQCSC